MDVERRWLPFVEVAALAWIALFVVDIAISVDALVSTGWVRSDGTAGARLLSETPVPPDQRVF